MSFELLQDPTQSLWCITGIQVVQEVWTFPLGTSGAFQLRSLCLDLLGVQKRYRSPFSEVVPILLYPFLGEKNEITTSFFLLFYF